MLNGDLTYQFSLFISYFYVILWESFPVIIEHPLSLFLLTHFDHTSSFSTQIS